MKKIIIIGAGISGISAARMLSESGYDVTVFEQDSRVGGLIKCDRVQGALYHRVGGHVFNSRNQKVLDWFWSHLPQEDFRKTMRHAVIALSDEMCVDYPIENHLYQLPESIRAAVVDDLLKIVGEAPQEARSFEEFLRHRFGETLYATYFGPYNRKIWRRELTDVPLHWLEGKLPMPTVRDILLANIGQVKEQQMVHSSFWYPKDGGSQYIADTLSKGLNIHCNSPVHNMERCESGWRVNGVEADHVIFCGNIKDLPAMMPQGVVDFTGIDTLEAHGTTSVLCCVQGNPYSWIYLPDETHEAHRIIMTGNFANSNNPGGSMTATIEFSAELQEMQIREQLRRIPFAPSYLAHTYTPYTYPMQQQGTRDIILSVKRQLKHLNVHLLGRFAEWEYYNMDAAMSAAMNLCKQIII